MAKFPEPPAALEEPAEIKVLPAETQLWRVHYLGGTYPSAWNEFRFWGPTTSRFDHHTPPATKQTRGVMYLADWPTTCLAEVFQATRVIDRKRDEPWLTGFETARDLRLLDLTGAWPTRAGASMAINAGPRPRAQRWSRLIYETYEDIDGLHYCSSMHANEPAVALYERARSALPAAPIFSRALADAALLSRLDAVSLRLGYALI